MFLPSEGVPAPDRPRHNGAVRRSIIWMVITVAGLGIYGFWISEEPSAPAPGRADAVVVHAGGRGERLDHALELMETGVAPTLVIMRGAAATWPQANALCGRTTPYTVLCPIPDPDTTIGEALALRDLAARHQWDRVLAVTSDYHLRRATYLDAKCSRVDVAGVAEEMAAMLQALIVSC